MKVKTWVPLVLAVILGLVAAKLTRDSIARGRAPVPQATMAVMVTAAGDIEPGQLITADLLTTGKVAAGSVPAGAFTSPAEAADRVALVRMVKDQPVLEGMLAPQGTAAGVQALIPPGMRAITIQVNEFSGLAGLLTPGCHVDIISVLRGGGGQTQQDVARTIAQNVEVRAVGKQISAGAAAAPKEGEAVAPMTSVTLLVSPAQAEAMQLAGSGGQPWLVLRNARDTAAVDSEGTTVADLRGEARKAGLPETEPVTVPVAIVTPAPEPTTKPAVEPEDPFVETPAPPAAPPAPRTRDVTFIRATKEEVVQVNVPEHSETVTSTNEPQDAGDDE